MTVLLLTAVYAVTAFFLLRRLNRAEEENRRLVDLLLAKAPEGRAAIATVERSRTATAPADPEPRKHAQVD